MRKWLDNYALTLAGLTLTLILSILAYVFPNKDQFIVISVGLMTTLVIATFEHGVPKLFATQIERKIEMYALLSKIEDKESRQWAQDILSECDYKLRQIAQGEFRSSMGAKYDEGRLCLAQKELRAVYLATVNQALGLPHWPKQPGDQEYYKENVEAIQRRIPTTRVFIIRRSKTIDKHIILDQTILDIMKQNQKDGISVRAVWEEEIVALTSGETLKDFIILDASEVDAREYKSDGTYEVVIWKNSAKVQYYERIFSLLYRHASHLDSFLAQIENALQPKP